MTQTQIKLRFVLPKNFDKDITAELVKIVELTPLLKFKI